jgi:2-(1,2-epoxy-1,2-dihydrophenyl)acetyl-CoA isomerase
MMEPPVLAEVSDGVAILRLNKPQALNAICAAASAELLGLLERCRDDGAVRAVLLTAGGRAFCAGSDLAAPLPVAMSSPGERGEVLLSQYFNPLIRCMREMPKPTVVAVNGLAVGGGAGLALSGDLVLMAQAAELQLGFGPQLGLAPDMGCSWVIPRLAGRARALGAFLTGAPIGAAQARDWGLVWETVADEALQQRAEDLARQLAEGPVGAFAEIRRLVDAGLEGGLQQQLELETQCQRRLMDGADFAEGLAAFKQKRAPKFNQSGAHQA